MHSIVLCYSIALTTGKYFAEKQLESILEWGICHHTSPDHQK